MRTKLCAFAALAVLAAVAVSAASARPPAIHRYPGTTFGAPACTRQPAPAAHPNAVPAADPNFTFKTFDVPNSTYTDVLGINNLGVMVGQYCTSDGCHGFIVRGGHITTVDVPGAVETGIQSINDLGTAVGWWVQQVGPDQYSVHGLIRLWSGAIRTIDDPNATPSIGPVTVAYGINDAGVVVGYYLTTLTNGDCCKAHGFQYRNGTFSDLDVPGYDNTVVWGINNVGEIDGMTTHLVDPSWSGFTGSTRVPGGGYSVFIAVGDTQDENGNTWPQAINDWGTVVGHSNGAAGYGIFVGWERLRNGKMVTISDPLANTTPDPSWTPGCGCWGGTAPGGINDFGTVTGIYFDSNEVGHGFIATPRR
jgi:probable HAF family extracellular repeat protein